MALKASQVICAGTWSKKLYFKKSLVSDSMYLTDSVSDKSVVFKDQCHGFCSWGETIKEKSIQLWSDQSLYHMDEAGEHLRRLGEIRNKSSLVYILSQGEK